MDNDIEISNNTNDNHQISDQQNEHQHATIDHNGHYHFTHPLTPSHSHPL